MRDHLLLYINGRRHEVRGADVFRTLSGFLREDLRLVGTKIVCEEGDCGACTVLIGRARNREVGYRPVNSCIIQMHQLDCAHVVTVEGLRENGALSEVQEKMVEHHGAQCGFCTPGFITAMSALFEEKDELSEHDVRRGLTGNLCRCTGYEPIIKAARAVEPDSIRRLDDLYPPDDLVEAFVDHGRQPVHVEAGDQVFFSAVDLEGAIGFKAAHPKATIVQGGTDVGVWCNKRAFVPEAVLNISRLEGLDEIAVRDGVLEVGGTVSLWDLQESIGDLIPELYDILEVFGAPQIRAAGTLAGNIANGSPIADTLPFLYVVDAELELAGLRHVQTDDGGEQRAEGGERRAEGGEQRAEGGERRAEGGERRAEGGERRAEGGEQRAEGGDGRTAETGELEITNHASRITDLATRRISIREFYRGYKDFDLAPDELITRILIPLPKDGDVLRLYKVSKRLDLDISTFTAAFLMQAQGEMIDEIRIAYGGVGPVVYRLPETEAFLAGKPITLDTFTDAGPIAREEITPISDVRGSADYRYQLAESVLLKFFHQVTGEEVVA